MFNIVSCRFVVYMWERKVSKPSRQFTFVLLGFYAVFHPWQTEDGEVIPKSLPCLTRKGSQKSEKFNNKIIIFLSKKVWARIVYFVDLRDWKIALHSDYFHDIDKQKCILNRDLQSLRTNHAPQIILLTTFNKSFHFWKHLKTRGPWGPMLYWHLSGLFQKEPICHQYSNTI